MSDTWETNMALVRPIWAILESEHDNYSDQDGWRILYALRDVYPALTPEQVTPAIVAEGLALIGRPARPKGASDAP